MECQFYKETIVIMYYLTIIVLIGSFNGLFASVSVYNQKNQSIEIMDDFSARFGPRLPDAGLKGYLLAAKPKNGCSVIQSPPNVTHITKWIALIQRSQNQNGNCSFDLKVLNAQNAGFAAVVIYNSDSDHLVRMSGSGLYNIKIPSVFVGLSDGLELERLYQYQNGSYLILTEDDYNVSVYLIPFAVIVGACFIIMLTIFAIKCAIYYHKTHKNRLSKSALKKLPVKKYQKSDKYDTCPICLDEYEEGVKIRLLPCEHVYHIKCIDEWLLKNNRSCPVCKRKVLPGGDSDDESSSDDHQRSTVNNRAQHEQEHHGNEEQDQPLLNAADEDDDRESSRLLNTASNKTTIVSMIPNTNSNRPTTSAEAIDSIQTLSTSANSNGSQYGSITQLDSVPTASPQVKIIDLNSPAMFTKKKPSSKTTRSKQKKKDTVAAAAAAAATNDTDSDVELLNDVNSAHDAEDDTRLLLPDVNTVNETSNSNTTKNDSFSKTV